MKNRIIALLLLEVTFVACKKDDHIAPSADFTYTVEGAFSPCKVSLAAASTDGLCQWTVDGTIYIGPELLTIPFDNPGSYAITLKVTADGVSSETTQTVVIPAAATIMKINTVTLTGYPLLKNGEKWDLYPISGPDVCFQLYGPAPEKPLLYLHDTAFEDRELVQNLEFRLPADARFALQPGGYHLLVVDNDNAGYADIMGEIAFNPWQTILASKTYPASLTVTQNGLTAVLDITWQ